MIEPEPTVPAIRRPRVHKVTTYLTERELDFVNRIADCQSCSKSAAVSLMVRLVIIHMPLLLMVQRAEKFLHNLMQSRTHTGGPSIEA